MTFLSRNKAYTFINILGFSLSLMFVIIISLYATQEYSVDKSIDKAGRIFSVCMDPRSDGEPPSPGEGINWRVQRTLQKAFPEIEMTCGVTMVKNLIKDTSGNDVPSTFMCADSTFFRMISIPLVSGDPAHVLDQPNSAVVSEEFARKMFGDKNPVGQVLKISNDPNDKNTLHVTGIYTTTDGTSFGKADFITRFETAGIYNGALTDPQMSNASATNVLLLTRDGSHLENKCRQIDKVLTDMGFWIYNMPTIKNSTSLLRLSDRYMSDIGSTSGFGTDNSQRGDPKLVGVLFGVALVILLFSVINYVNLTVAQSTHRAKEMATRRLLGAQRGAIMARLIAESTLLCTACLGMALAMSYVALPYVARLLNTELHFARLFSAAGIATGVLAVVAVGVTSGIIPAIVISRPKPIDIVRGTFRMHTKMRMSKVFIVLQNTITIIMMTVAAVMTCQMRHLVNAPLGYDYKNLIELPNIGDSLQINTFLNEVRKLPCVTGAVACMGYPLDGGNNNTATVGNKIVSFQILIGSEGYMKLLGLKTVRDYHTADPNAAYVNRQLLTELGLPLTARSFNDGHRQTTVAGVLADFKIRDIQAQQHPVILQEGHTLKYAWSLLVKVRGDEAAAYDRVAATYKKIMKIDPSLLGDTPFVDKQLEDVFEKEIRTATIMELFAAIAIVISLLGLVAMSTYFVGQRRKDIAIRKVFGSTSGQIYVRLLRTFLGYVAVAFVIAVPVAWHFAGSWLSEYSYRISLSPWFFAASGLTCLAVSFVAVTIQCRAAANANPIKWLKAE